MEQGRYYYKFMPTKAEEVALKANKAKHEVTSTPVEINYSLPFTNEFGNPLMINRRLRCIETVNGRFLFPGMEASTYVFPYWTSNMVNEVMSGNKVRVRLLDVTEKNNPRRYADDSVYFKKMPDDFFVLNCKELFVVRKLLVNDEIGLSWDPRAFTFEFKLIRTALGAALHE